MRMSEAEFLNRLAYICRCLWKSADTQEVLVYHLFNGLPAEALFGKKQGISNPICTVEIHADRLPIIQLLNWPTMCFEPIR